MIDPIPAFRRDLNVVARNQGESARYLVEHPVSGAIIELGEVEYFLCTQMDGITTAGEIARRHDERFGRALPVRQIEALVRQLDQYELLERGDRPLRRRTFPEWIDPERFLVVKHFRWRGADRFMERLARAASPLFSRSAALLAAAAVVWAIHILYTRWDPFLSAIGSRWGYEYFLAVILPGCLVVRSARSLAHGLKAKREGGRIPAAGLALLYYLLPSFYCDWWSDVVWTRDKSRRYRMILAGLYFQLVLWATGTLGWWLSRPDSLANDLWLGLALSSALTLLLLSANPLVMMEGYALLLNWLEIPRLRERALAVFGAWAFLQPPPEAMRFRERLLFGLYGGLVTLYAAAMVALHLWLAWLWLTEAFEGAGALITFGIALYMLQRPILDSLGRLRAVRWLFARRAGAPQWAARIALAGGLVSLALLPCHYETGGAFTILPGRRHEVRTQIEGMIERVFVREGDGVEAGQPIARLRQPDPATGLEMARARLRETRAAIRLLLAGAKAEAVERAAASVREAETKLSWSDPRATRYAELHEQKLLSRQELDDAQWIRDGDWSELEEARAQLALVASEARAEQIEALEARARKYEAQIEDYETQIALSELTSPASGRILTPHIDRAVGRYLKAGDLFATIGDTRTVLARVDVPEGSARDVAVGAPVRLVAWSEPDQKIEGRVIGVAPVATPAEGGPVVRVTTEIPDAGGVIRPEMTGFAKVAVGTRPLGQVLFWKIVRFVRVRVWSWIP